MVAGLRLGAIWDNRISNNFYFQPAFLFVMNGCKESIPGALGQTLSVNTIEIPLNFTYKTGKPGENRVFFGLGPYIGANLSAKVKFDDGSGTQTLNIGSDKSTDDIKRFDVGIGLCVGDQLSNGFFVSAHYQAGFTNLYTITDGGASLRNYNMGLTVGYFFPDGKRSRSMHKGRK